ncbi:cytochrome c class I [Adhaeribacter arboris]|uniref:Cytochrome c class I n=2 Tax=Adhaeribacter arboris TaxID=2072846 RepID=A0A2T2YJL0_9BACT|nr:cytochrome c class I [Adhaeribacter arboris]
MNKQVILLAAAFSFTFLTGCGSQTKQPGEEFYDPDYRAKADSAYEENQKNQPVAQAQPATRDTNSEKFGPNASTHSAASEAPAAQADKSQASAPGKIAGTTPTEGNSGAAPTQTKPAATGGNFEKGKALLAKSDCLACHKVDQKVVGPAYQDVAKKYEANDKNITYLTNKIIKGGAGVWGDVPMSPHPTLPPADAKAMAQYILSLR